MEQLVRHRITEQLKEYEAKARKTDEKYGHRGTTTATVLNALHEMPEVRGLAIGVSFGEFSDSTNKPPNQRNGIRRSYKKYSQNSDKPTKIVHRGSLPSG